MALGHLLCPTHDDIGSLLVSCLLPLELSCKRVWTLNEYHMVQMEITGGNSEAEK